MLGFASGLPLLLTATTLQAWLSTAGMDLTHIAWLGLTSLPYTLKFLWAPGLDRWVLPGLGRRRGWIGLCQFGLFLGLMTLAQLSPLVDSVAFVAVVFVIVLLSATQDIAIDAYRAEILPMEQRGLGASVFVLGYRLSMLVAGSGALLLASVSDWTTVYQAMAALVLLLLLITLHIVEPPAVADSGPVSLQAVILQPLQEFWARPGAAGLLALIVCYKLGDSLAGALTLPFLLRGLEFSLAEVAYINQGLGLVASIAGGLGGGLLMLRLNLFQALLWFGLLQMVSNLSFMILAGYGKSNALMAVAVVFENLSGGMGTAALVALLMSLCNPRFTAAQFALLSALAALGRLLSPVAGSVAVEYGWVNFFLLTVLLSLPGLGLVWRLRCSLGVRLRD